MVSKGDNKAILDYSFSGGVELYQQDAGKEFSFDTLNKVDVFVIEGNNLISPSRSLLRHKLFDQKNIVAFVPDSSRNGAYNGLSKCEQPEKKKFRLCAAAGSVPGYNDKTKKVEDKRVEFKVAVEVGERNVQ